MAQPTTTALALTVERTIAAPPEKVFEAFTQAQKLSRWFAPSDEFTVTVHALELRPGGRYRIEMKNSDGSIHTATGTYEEITPPKRLVFSWSWAEMPERNLGRVTVSLEPKGTGTRVVLVHEQLPDADARQKHGQGWNGCLDRLARLY